MEKKAMRKLYGSVAGVMLALLMLTAATAPVRGQSYILYPTLSLRNFHLPPGDGNLRVPPPNGADRYFLVPVWVYNEMDTTKNPNNSWLVSGNPNGPPGAGQHLEPIRSFNFQLWYNNEVMELDTLHGSPVLMNGPSIVSGQTSCNVVSHPDTGLATPFFVTYTDQSANDPNNPYSHTIRLAGASSIPLAKNATHGIGGDTGYNEHDGILLWLRFHVIPGAAPGGNMFLDSSEFNDHWGDTGTGTVGSLPFNVGNLGGGVGAQGAINRGQLTVLYLNSGPSYELVPVPNFTILNPAVDSLNSDLVYDPTVFNGQVAQSFNLTDGVPGTELDNVTITSDQPWLNINCGNTPQPGSTSLFLGWDAIDELGITTNVLAGPQLVQLWLTVPNPQLLSPGIYYATVTFSNADAINTPFQLRLRFVREQAPDEPTPGGTGIQLQITNSCVPTCTQLLTFGTGPGATDGLDVLYGEQPVTTGAANTQDTCIAYFVPQDPAVLDTFNAHGWAGMNRDIRDSITDSTLIYQVNFNPGNVDCYPVKVCVDPTQFPTGARLALAFTLNGSEQPVDLRNATVSNGLECVTITDHRITQFYIEYTPATIVNIATFIKPYSWSLISLPVIPPDPSAGPPNGPLFNYALTVPYQYQSSSGWEQQSTLEFGRGYMIRYGSYIGNNGIVAGSKSYTASNVEISEGWNSIGGTSSPGTFDGSDGTVITLQPLPGGQVPTMETTEGWEFTPQSGYDMTDFLIPGRGYFIKVDQPGYWNITTPIPISGTRQVQEPAGKVAMRQNLQGELTHLQLTDADGNGRRAGRRAHRPSERQSKPLPLQPASQQLRGLDRQHSELLLPQHIPPQHPSRWGHYDPQADQLQTHALRAQASRDATHGVRYQAGPGQSPP
jgi:hypothetical protein